MFILIYPGGCLWSFWWDLWHEIKWCILILHSGRYELISDTLWLEIMFIAYSISSRAIHDVDTPDTIRNVWGVGGGGGGWVGVGWGWGWGGGGGVGGGGVGWGYNLVQMIATCMWPVNARLFSRDLAIKWLKYEASCFFSANVWGLISVAVSMYDIDIWSNSWPLPRILRSNFEKAVSQDWLLYIFHQAGVS